MARRHLRALADQGIDRNGIVEGVEAAAEQDRQCQKPKLDQIATVVEGDHATIGRQSIQCSPLARMNLHGRERRAEDVFDEHKSAVTGDDDPLGTNRAMGHPLTGVLEHDEHRCELPDEI